MVKVEIDKKSKKSCTVKFTSQYGFRLSRRTKISDAEIEKVGMMGEVIIANRAGKKTIYIFVDEPFADKVNFVVQRVKEVLGCK